MVNYGTEGQHDLDLVFGALASPVRRSMLRQLASGGSAVADLGAPLTMSAPAVSRHLRVLERAGLVHRTRSGRSHVIRLRRPALEPASAFLVQLWSERFDALSQRLGEEVNDDG